MCGGILEPVANIIGIDDPSAPDYGPIAETNAEAARYARQSAEEDLAFRKQVYEENKPRMQQLYDLATKVANQQLGIADENQAFAERQRDVYEKSYLPNEYQTMADAYGASYLGDEDRAQLNSLVAGEGDMTTAARMAAMQALGIKAENAAGGIAARRAEGQANASFGQQARMLGRLGAGDPQRMALIAAKLGQQQTLAKVGASNQAREAARGQMLGLRSGVANFGRNMPNTAGQAFGLATQAGSSATGNQNAAAMSGLPYAQFQAGGYGGALGAAALQQQGALGLGGLLSRDYGTKASMYNNELDNFTEMMGYAAGGFMAM